MKYTLLFSLFLILTTHFYSQEVNIGVFIHAPHVYKMETTDDVYGPAIDYISIIVKDMGYKPVFHLFPLPRILVFLKSGQLDMTLELIKTTERESFLYYSDKPVYIRIPSLTFLSSNKINNIFTIRDLSNMKIGYLSGAITSTFFDNSTNIVFESVSGDNWIQQNLSKLLAGRIDAAMDNNDYSYREAAKGLGIVEKIKTLNIPGEVTNYYVVFSKSSAKGLELSKKYNSLYASGKYNEQKMIDDFINK